METYNTPRNRLALTYLTLIMVLSVGFSAVFYYDSSRAAGHGFNTQATALRKNIYFAQPDAVLRIRDDGIDRFNNNLLARLIFLNIFMLGAGILVSYYLAKRSLEPMEEAMAAQSRFTSDAAHELRTPLTAMKTEIEVGLRSKKLQSEEAKEILGSNLEEIAKLEVLTEALLRLAKNSHQPDPSSWKSVKITDVINTAALRVEPDASKRGIAFDLPESSKATIKADRDQLVQLFVILMENAVKYGTDNTAVVVSALRNDKEIVISITDKGMGISEKDLPHIFDRFYRADQSRNKAKSSGYGLGLSLAEAIVKSHNGSITATSKLGEGSTFIVTLPR